MSNEPQVPDKAISLESVSEVSQDYQLLQARNSKPYVATMVDVCTALNSCPMGKMKNMDVEELRNQTGHLLFYTIKGVDDPIPCDIEFIPQLYSHFRRPTVLVLKRVQKFLMSPHRRILGRLEREQALEKLMDMGTFDISQKIRLSLEEINRYQKMSEMVRGGGRKLDILMQALHVPSRARFELLSVDRILRDQHHPRYNEAMEWLKGSKFKGNAKAVHSLINNGFQMLDNATNKILDIMEDLSGLQMPRDATSFDVHRNWYSLGNSLPRGEEFIKSFTSEDRIDRQIKRLTFPMVRVGWDAGRMTSHKDRLLVDINLPKALAAQLSNLFFELEKKVSNSTKPDGEVMVAIEADFNKGLLSIREREEAEAWARENKIKLQELMMETYQALQEIKEKNPKIALPEQLEESISKIKDGVATDRSAHQQNVEAEIGNITIEPLIKAVEKLESRLENPDGELLAELAKAKREIGAKIDLISIKNIDFHKKVRDAYQDFAEYENKVLELYKMEEQLEQMRVNVEGWLIDCYRVSSYVGIPEKVLSSCMEVVIEHMMIKIKKLEYNVIDAEVMGNYLDEALKLDDEECLVHLDQLIQEIQAVPRSDQLLNALHDWEKDLPKDEIREKESFIVENSDNLQELVDQARAELRERINEPGKVQSRRLRFEVFGLSDCYSESLRSILTALLGTASQLANVQEGEQLIKSLQSLEAQVLEAQKLSKPGGEALKKLKTMAKNDQLSPGLAKELEKDLQANFSELDQILEETSAGLKRVKLLQNRFGGKKDTDYLDVTLNIHDLERLKEVYDFIDTVTMEDIKRFCVSYNLKSGLISNIFEKAKKKDVSVPKVVLQQFNNKAYKMFKEKRHISLPLKTAIMKDSKEIFESECQLLCHTLNLVKPDCIRKKASYLSVMALLGQCKTDDHQILRMLGLLWGRIQTRMFKFDAVNHKANFEGNRQAMITDVNELVGDKFKR